MTRFAVALGLAALGAFTISAATTSGALCKTGDVQGYALITGSRIGGPGAIPNKFTAAQRYFGRRYNCTRRLISVRRIDEGRYEVRFPANRAVAVSASAFNMEGTASSAVALGGGSFLVRLLGPGIDRNVLEPRDTPFVIVLF